MELSARNAALLIEVFRDFGFREPPLAALFLEPGNIVRVGWQPNRLEVINKIDGVSFDACWKTRIAGLRVNFIDLVHLRQNKLASGRPKDLEDLRQLPG